MPQALFGCQRKENNVVNTGASGVPGFANLMPFRSLLLFSQGPSSLKIYL